MLVFGMLEREGKVHVEVVPNVQVKTLVGAVRSTSALEARSIPTGCQVTPLCSFTGMNTSVWIMSVALPGKAHSNGLEVFWSCSKERRAQYHRVASRNFYLYIKEMEFRYNHQGEDSLFGYLIKEVMLTQSGG